MLQPTFSSFTSLQLQALSKTDIPLIQWDETLCRGTLAPAAGLQQHKFSQAAQFSVPAVA